LIALPALINLDFADVKTVMESGGMAHIGIGVGKGENRMVEAARSAVASPLLETKIDGARAVLINITGSEEMGIVDINEAARLIQESADSDANIIFGAGIENGLKDEVRITVIATGFEKGAFPVREQKRKPYRSSIPYGQATAAINPYENRPAASRTDLTGFEPPQVSNIYEQEGEASFFPAGTRPAVTNAPPSAMPPSQIPGGYQPGHQGYSFGQQPFQQPQQGTQSPYQPPMQPQPQQPQMAEKDDLGVPAYLRRKK
jgi:hypothetical protein